MKLHWPLTALLLVVLTICNAQTTTHSFVYDGETRTYRVHLPPGFSPLDHTPLVLNLHGLSSNGQQQELYTGFNNVADTAGIVVVYPDALPNTGGTPEWNAYGLGTTDDIGFLSALIDSMHSQYNIDLSRVYSTGLSNGGYMSHRLACSLNCRIAAIASVAGLLVESPLTPCNPSRPIAIMQIHGTNDATVSYSGVAATISSWVSKNGCPGTPTTTNLPDVNTSDNSTVTVDHYGPCNNSTEVILYTINNGGHTWPDAVIDLPGLVTNHDFNANSTIWNFLKQYSIPEADLSISGLGSAYCPGDAPVTLTATPSGGTFSGTGVSGSSFDPSAVTPGSTVSITYSKSSGSCNYSVSESVNIHTTPTASITPASVTICTGGNATLTASGGTSYAWSNNDMTASTTVSPTTTTNYTVTVSDANGCTASATKTVTVVPNITASITPANTSICNGESIALTASGGSTYSWSNNAATSTITVNPSTTTTYTVTITDGSSCSATASRTVTVNTNPTAAISPANPAVCNGQNIMLTASGGTSYAWSNNDMTASTTVSPSTTTGYTVTVTDANGCTASDDATVTVSNITATIAPANPAICRGDSIILTASGGTTYSWNNAASTATITDAPDSMTVYSVTVTDGSGCSATTSTMVTVTPLPEINVSTNPPSIMQGETTTLSASGGTSYLWSNGQTTASFTDTPTTTTTYTVTVIDANGCSNTAQATVTVQPTGIADIQSPLTFSLYPNPSDGRLNVLFSTKRISSFVLDIFTIEGKLVYTQILTEHLPPEISLGRVDLKAGIYFVRIKTGIGLVTTKKWVVTD